MKLLPRVLGVCAIALSAGAAFTGAASAAPGCTGDTWTNTAGGSWDTGSNWSLGAAPTSGETACITAAGSYTVVVGNETITVANLTVGGTGSTPTLQIGNGGSGEPNITVSGATTNAGTISAGWEGTYNFGALTNSGTFEIPSSGYTSFFTFASVANTGTFTAADNNPVTLGNGGTFDNAGGTVSVTGAGGALAITSPTSGSGTLELGSGGQVDIATGDSLTVADTVALNGGSICGTPLTIGSGDGGTGGTLAFAATPGTGPACGTGVASDQVFIDNTHSTLSGTIPAAYTVTAGDGGSNFNYTALSGDVVNDGTFAPGYGATVTGSGTTDELTNEGTLLIPASGYTSNLNSTLVNTGTVTVDDGLNVSLATGQSWTNGTKGTNGTISLASGKTLAIGSPSGETATFTQDGTIDDSGTFNVADTIQINGGTICGDALNLGSGDGGTGGTLAFVAKPTKGAACAKGLAAHKLFIYNVTATLTGNIPAGYTVASGDGGSSYAHVSTPGSLTNAGTLEPGFGGSFTVNGTLTNTSTGKLTIPASGYTTPIVATTLVNSGAMTVSGTATLTGSLTNSKTLKLAVGKDLAVSGTYTQGAKGTLTDALSSAGYGQLQVTGTATLAGTAALKAAKAPPKGASYPFITDGGTSGTFAKVTGAFTLSYGSTGVTANSTTA